MSRALEIVQNFCAQWDESVEKVYASFREHFTPETIWDNVGFAVTKGPEEAIALWDSFATKGFNLVRVEMLNIAASGDVVLTERIDHLIGLDGNVLISAPLMGAFVLEGEKIIRWSDYVDPRVYDALAKM